MGANSYVKISAGKDGEGFSLQSIVFYPVCNMGRILFTVGIEGSLRWFRLSL